MSRPTTSDAQVRDLERIVGRQPESKFFAALAEAYVERGDHGRAVEVCEHGLRANPGFVRGLVVYARALLLAGREEAAQEIFRQARAENPRDSSVSTAWGGLLASLGRHDEARAALTEALHQNPLDVDAKRLLATLPGGGPPPAPGAGRKTVMGHRSMVAPPPEPEEDADTVMIEDRPFDGDSAEATIPHSLAPPVSPPAPSPYPPAPSYPPSGGTPAPYQPLSPPPPGYPAAPASQPPPPPPYAAPPPATWGAPLPPPAQAQPAWGPPPPPAQAQPAWGAPPPPPAQAQPAWGAPPPPPAQAQPAWGAPPPPPPPKPRASASPARGGQARRLTADIVIPGAKKSSSKTVIVVALVVVALIVGVALYLRGQGRGVTTGIAATDTALLDGSPAGFREAETRLAALQAAHPRASRVSARLAEVAAMRALRFDGGAESLKRAEEAARRAESQGGPNAALTARALLKIRAGDAAGAAADAKRGVAAGGSPWGTLVVGLAERARGDLAAAEEQLAISWAAQPPSALAGCELASVQRRRGRLSEARATLDAVRAAAPQDLCTRLESLLLLRQSGAEGTRVEREALREPSAPHVALFARHAYAEALVAQAEAAEVAGRTHLEAAVKAAPWEPEYALALGRALLMPGGDARQALVVLEKCAPTAGVPEAPLDLAEARLRLGLAVEAAAGLDKVTVEQLPETERGRFDALRLWARRDLLQGKAVQVYCSAVDRSSTAGDEVLLACAVASLDDGLLPEARRFAGRVKRQDLRPTSRGLGLLAQGDPTGAAESLGRAAEGHADPGGAGLLLAEALTAAARDEAARRALRAAMQADASSVRSRVALAQALAETRREEAVGLIDGILKEKPTAPRVVCRIARALVAVGDHARAAQALAGLGERGDAPLVHYTAGLVALAASDTAKAQTEFQAAAAADQSYAEPRFELAKLAVQAGRADDATARYDAALRPGPEDPYRRMRLAVAQAEAGNFDEAERTLETARKGLETGGARGLLAGALVKMARAAAAGDAKQARRAESLFSQATSLQGAPAFVLYQAARHHESRHDLRSAYAEYRSAIERDPQLAEAYLRLGLLLATDPKNRDEAAARLIGYLRIFKDGEHSDRARSELKRMGRTVP